MLPASLGTTQQDILISEISGLSRAREHYERGAAIHSPEGLYLSPQHKTLAHFLGGGVRFGEITEWGLPAGQGGREVILSFLAASHKHTNCNWCVWIHARRDQDIYGPAWLARGICGEHTRFAQSLKPLHELKSLFLNPFFRIIVLDAPEGIGNDECAFLAQRARSNKQAIFILRDYRLSEARGNVWARLRVNCWREEREGNYVARVVRGLSTRQLSFQMEAAPCS